MAQSSQSAPLWSQMKNSSSLQPSDEELLQQLINSGSLAGQSPGPAAPAPAAAPKGVVVKKAAPRATRAAPAPAPAGPPAAPLDPTDPRSASAGTYHDPFEDIADSDLKRDIALKNRVLFQSPTELASRYEGIEKMIPAVQELEQGNRDYKNLINMRGAQPQQADLSGVMALGDVLSNGKFNLRGGYTAPGDKAKELLANMDKAQDNQTSLMKDVVALANSGKAGYDTSTLYQQILDKINRGYKTAPPPRPSGISGNQTLAFGRATQTEAKDLKARGEMLDTLVNTLTSNNPTALQSIPTLAARFIEGTVRPQLAVITREGGNPSFWQSSLNKLTKLATGQIPAEQLGEYADFFRGLQAQHQRDVAGSMQRWKVMAKKINLSDKDFNDMVGQGWANPHQASTTGALENAPGKGGAGGPQLSNHDQKIQDAIKSNEALMKKLDDLQKGGQ